MSGQRFRSLSLCLLVVALAAVAAACGDGTSSGNATPTPDALVGTKVRIGELSIQAEVARTPEERGQGLSERPSLPDDGGMLFVFPDERRPGFWMRGMRFALDFIWISRDRRVVDLTQDVPPPEPDASQLPLYRPAQPVLYVLEVNAGTIRQFGVQVGDTVTLEPPVSSGDAR